MAIYRNIQVSFWTDSKVVDDFTPEDRYFYLYLFTNPHTNLCGCYELSLRQASIETGYTVETIERLIYRMNKIHHVAIYDKVFKEILLINWHKYNWTMSKDFRKALIKEIDSVKAKPFKSYLMGKYEKRTDGDDTVCTPSLDGGGTTVTVSVTDTNTNTVNNINNKTIIKNKKHKYGEYNHVLLTDEEHQKLVDEYGDQETDKAIKYLDEYIEMKGTKYKSHYLALRKWVFDAIKEKKQEKKNNLGLFGDYKQTSSDDEWDELTRAALKDVNHREDDNVKNTNRDDLQGLW